MPCMGEIVCFISDMQERARPSMLSASACCSSSSHYWWNKDAHIDPVLTLWGSEMRQELISSSFKKPVNALLLTKAVMLMRC